MEISIYEVIGPETAVSVKNALMTGLPITLRINSPGGSVTDALAIFNLLKQHNKPVTAVIDGLCASAATLVAIGSSEIVMAEHSLMMIHNPWTAVEGDAHKLRTTAGALDKASAEMAALYAKRAGIGLEAAEALMGKETWLNAYEAVEAGFADRVDGELIGKPRIAASAVTYLAGTVKDTSALQKAQQRLEESKAKHLEQIKSLIAPFQHIPQIQNLKEQGIMSQNTEQARATLMAALGQDTSPSQPAINASAYHLVGNGNIIRDGMTDALSARLGLSQAQDRNNPFRTMSLLDMARASLTERGLGVASYGTKMQMVGAAFTHTSSDFGQVLMNVSEKAMLRGWQNSGETFNRWTKKGELANFHPTRRVGMSGFASLPKVPEGAEYRYVTCSDRGAPIALATYGGIFGITRQAIINDDLSAFSTLPNNLGRAASRTIGDLVYAVLTGNEQFTDGKALFHSDHGNTDESGAALTPALLGELRRKMRLQKDSAGETLNIAPAFVIVPAALETAAIQVLHSTSMPGADSNSGIINPVNQMGELIVESRLDSAANPYWYLAAEQGSDTIEVAYLDGVDTPYLEQQEGWTVDGVSFKVRIDAGVAPLDYRGLARAKYTA